MLIKFNLLISIFFSIENHGANCSFYSITNEVENLCMEMEDKLNTTNESLNQSDIAPVKELDIESILNRDLEMEEYAKCFRSVYENQFRQYLKTLQKNDLISVTSMPTKAYCKETYEIDSMNTTTLSFNFDSLELDDSSNVVAVVASSFDRVHTYFFDSFLCDTYGPFFGTKLYISMYNVGRSSSQEQMFFLDLPLSLYNLIEMDE